MERVHCNGVATGCEIPSLDAFTDHVHLLGESGFLGEDNLGSVGSADFAGSELEGEGDVVQTALFNLDVLSACCEGILCLAFVDIAEVGVCAHLACIVEGDLPSAAVSELELTVLGHVGVLDGIGDSFVGECGSFHLGEAPAVHRTTYAPLYGSDDNLSLGKVVSLVEVEHDVIETGVGNLHCGSGVAGLESTLEDSHLGIFAVDGAALFGSELGKSCAVAGLFAGLIELEVELFAALKHDVLLVHSVALGLVGSLVSACGHHIGGFELGNSGSFSCHIETILNSLVEVLFFVVAIAGCKANGHKCSCTQKKKLFHKTF